MRYSTQPRETKYNKRICFLSLARKLSDKYDEKLMETVTKTAKSVGMDAAKLHLKELLKHRRGNT